MYRFLNDDQLRAHFNWADKFIRLLFSLGMRQVICEDSYFKPELRGLRPDIRRIRANAGDSMAINAHDIQGFFGNRVCVLRESTAVLLVNE